MYKINADVVRSFNVLSIYILRISNACMSKADMKELPDVDWMSVRLKEEIAVVLLIKLTFV